ncbi:MAG: hypothetical protein WCG73_03575, partial [Candidatus Moraniibacteriota bacterium]
KNFYTGGPTQNTSMRNQERPVRQEPSGSTTVGKNAHIFFFVLGGISLLSLLGVGAFFFLPKAEIRVTPYKITQTIDKEFNGKLDTSVSSEDVVPARIFEKEKEVTVTVTTTGKSGGTNQKARGTVVIYNNFSVDPQPLIATTRLETSDGKLFRLVSGVTVPARTTINGKTESGAIEAQIIADQTGAEYNVDAETTFTIPGFKGSPKYDTFSAKLNKAMTGGGSGGVSDVAIVAKVDLDSALREAKDKAKEIFLTEIRGEVTLDEKILDEQVDIVAATSPQLPSIGTVANSLEYKGTFKLRAFAFSEKIVKEKIESTNEKNIQAIPFRSVSSNITYSDSSADFTASTLRIKAHALVVMESSINQDKLKETLMGKNESGIEQSLQGLPEIKSIQVVFFPQWFIQTVPNSASRISVIVLPGEDGP